MSFRIYPDWGEVSPGWGLRCFMPDHLTAWRLKSTLTKNNIRHEVTNDYVVVRSGSQVSASGRVGDWRAVISFHFYGGYGARFDEEGLVEAPWVHKLSFCTESGRFARRSNKSTPRAATARRPAERLSAPRIRAASARNRRNEPTTSRATPSPISSEPEAAPSTALTRVGNCVSRTGESDEP
jgi:hypothetical protein